MYAWLASIPGSIRGRSRRIEFIALLGTMPAFYLAILSTHRPAGTALYLVASIVTACVTWTEARAARLQESARQAKVRPQLGSLLSVALLLSALLPQGDMADLVIVRLGAAVLTVLRLVDSAVPPFWRRGLPQLLALGIGVFGLCGLGFWWLEPGVRSFGDGLWLAFTTAATVGYGDIVPSTPAAKIFAVFVVLMGVAVLSLVTASIAALWVQSEERRIGHEILRDLHREMQRLRDELAAMRRDAHRDPD